MSKATIRQSFSRAATTYDAHAILQQAVLEKAQEILLPYLSSRAFMLDAGCGTGAYARLAKPARLIQLDSAVGMAQIARTNGYPAVCADICAMPFMENHFDALISSLCLQWVGEPQKAIREACRVLKPGGAALLTSLGPKTLKELREAFLTAGLSEHVNDFQPAHHLDKALEENGLRLLLFKQETRILYFETPLTLLRHLKGLGATYKASGGGLHGRFYLRRLEASLRERWPQDIPASFEVFYFLAEKS